MITTDSISMHVKLSGEKLLPYRISGGIHIAVDVLDLMKYLCILALELAV